MTSTEFDRQHLWHPYSNVMSPGPTHMITGADGVRLTLADGGQMIDAMSSWWCAIHGYGHPSLVKALTDQAQKLSHVMFGGLTHEPAVELGRRLLALVPSALQRIFYCDSGSVAVEIALKMAVQYQVSRGQVARTGFVALRGGYHGDTWKAMSVCDPVTGMHHLFSSALSPQCFAPRPPVRYGDQWIEDEALNGIGALRQVLEANRESIAALILEPVVQGAGGMYFYHPRYLDEARALCDEHGILLIFDEIATGFGRTGRLFAADHCQIAPDILCLGKALTGGMMSFAAVLATDGVAEGIAQGEVPVFMHGPTFMGNPLACAVASASLDLLATSDWQNRVGDIEKHLATELAPARALPHVVDVRVLGAIGVIEMDHPVRADQAHPLCRDLGVWLRPFGRNIYCMPPFVTAPDDVRSITRAMLHLAEVL